MGSRTPFSWNLEKQEIDNSFEKQIVANLFLPVHDFYPTR
jgi:hypothetical protein